jgi:hypothetical protein
MNFSLAKTPVLPVGHNILPWLDERGKHTGGSGEEVKGNKNSLSHSKWDCKYRIVFIRKKPQKASFGQARRHFGGIFPCLGHQKECQIWFNGSRLT